MKLSDRLRALVDERHLLKHPFYKAWSDGSLSREVLCHYAAQYNAQVQSFPRFVSAVHSRCPEISARKVLLQNLLDEELHGTDHPTLWMQFATGMGATAAQVRAEAPLPETSAMVDTFFELAHSHWTDGLCALFAYECQVPAVSASKIDGLVRFYGVRDETTLAFFRAHLEYDVAHSRAVAELVDQHAEPAAAERATIRAAQSLWGFLDGVSREAGIDCRAA